jgi:predicted HicB family RNase H-like nuclease
MRHMLEYKGYPGSVEYSDEDGLFFGRVQFTRALISYEGRDAASLRRDFRRAVDDYLALCAKRGKEPEKPFKGSFNVRVGPELHRRLALAAAKRGMSLNRLVAETLKEVA